MFRSLTIKYLSVFIILLGYVVTWPCTFVYAADSELTPILKEEPDQPDNKKSIFFSLDSKKEVVSTGLNSFVNIVDNYFFNEKVFSDATGSYMRLRGDAIWDEEIRDVKYTGDVKLKLNLPRTKRKLKLIFVKEPDEISDGVDPVLKDTPLDVAEDTTYYAGIQRKRGKEDKWLYRTSIGMKVRTPPEYFIRVRADRRYKLNDWLLRLDEGIFYFDNTKGGVDTSAEFNYELHNKVLYRSRSYARFTDTNDYFDLSQVFSVFHFISKRKLMAYELGSYAITKPIIFATDHRLAFRYRQDIHNNYLFFEIVPQTNYRKENGFHPEHSIMFRLEIVFDG